jgi:tetratricopeptide (TPR) repeat protein
LLAAALLAAWWAYSPGLSGGFLFDDFNNLNQLGTYGRVDNLKTLALYVTSGNADPTGRPLSLLSFLLDARDWPADPGPFKRTNILLHLLNGTLLIQVLLQLGLRLNLPQPRARLAAVLGGCLWLLHPLLVSTTLYVVQREAMLPATFTLLGILCWIEGTRRAARNQRHARAFLLAGAWGCTLLSALCKANGVLLPLLLLVIGWTIPDSGSIGTENLTALPSLRRARFILLGLPSILLVAWLASKLPEALSGQNVYPRPWTSAQRLLSEPRALVDYLSLLWVPQASGASVFNDGFPPSTSWLQPWSTLPCVLGISLLFALGLKSRRSQPAVSLAILFYFAGHLLESSIIPLELYFEHRNYLPSLLMFWPLALWLTGPGSLKVLRQTLAVALPLLLALLCHARCLVWGKPYEQALLLARVDPQSPRAQANAAAFEMAHGRPDLASSRLRIQTSKAPEEVQLALNWIAADCARGEVSPAAYQAAQYALARNHGDTTLVYNWLISAIDKARVNSCRGLALPEIEGLVRVMTSNLHFSDNAPDRAILQQLQGRLSLAQGNGEQALRDFDAGLLIWPTPSNALIQAAALGNAGYPIQGLQHLQYFRSFKQGTISVHDMPSLHLWLLERTGYWRSELAHMETQLREDAQERPYPIRVHS